MQNICVVFVLNVKNDRLDATDFLGGVNRCNFHFNFTQCNMFFVIIIFFLFLKYYDVNLI